MKVDVVIDIFTALCIAEHVLDALNTRVCTYVVRYALSVLF